MSITARQLAKRLTDEKGTGVLEAVGLAAFAIMMVVAFYSGVSGGFVKGVNNVSDSLKSLSDFDLSGINK